MISFVSTLWMTRAEYQKSETGFIQHGLTVVQCFRYHKDSRYKSKKNSKFLLKSKMADLGTVLLIFELICPLEVHLDKTSWSINIYIKKTTNNFGFCFSVLIPCILIVFSMSENTGRQHHTRVIPDPTRTNNKKKTGTTKK